MNLTRLAAGFAVCLSFAARAADSSGYIESNGLFGFDTGYYVNAKTKIEIDFQMTTNASLVSYQMRIFGMDGTGCGNHACVYFGGNQGTDRPFKVGYGNDTFSSELLTDKCDQLRHTVVYDSPNNVCTISTDGAVVGSAALTAAHEATAAIPLALFAEHQTSGASYCAALKAWMRLYGCRIYEDGELIHTFTPAMKNGSIGLYDEVDATFHAVPIQGFTAGGDLEELGDAPVSDAYIESDGTQFVNTGYFVNPRTRIELDCSIPNFADTADYSQMRLLDNLPAWQNNRDSIASTIYICGAAGNGNYAVAFSVGETKYGTFVGKGTISVGVGSKVPYCDATRRTLVVDEPNKMSAVVESGETKWYYNGWTSSTNVSQCPLCLFGALNDTWATTCKNQSRIRVYGLKIFESDVLVHDYRPTNQGGRIGLKDAVTGTFIDDSRQSPGTLTASADVPLVAEDPYIESDGTSAICTGVCPQPGLKVEVDYAFTDVSPIISADGSTTNYQQRLFGVDTTGGARATWPRVSFYINMYQAACMAYGDGWVYKSTKITADLNRHSVAMAEGTGANRYGNGPTAWMHWDGVTITNVSQRPMALFGDANDDDGTSFINLSKARIYRARFWIGDRLVRDFRPCVQGGVAGFEDVAEGGFYTCSGPYGV